MSNNERRWTRTSIDCYNRCYSNDGTFRNGCVNCPDKEFCKTADFALMQVVNDLIELCGKPSIKKEKEFILSGFCIDQDCKYCKLLEDDKLQIFCKHPYKLKKTFPKYGFKCQQYERRTKEEEKQTMNTVASKIEIPQPEIIHNFKAPTLIKKEVSISDLIERAKKKIAGEIEAIEKQILDLNLNFSNSNEVRRQIHNKKMEHKELSVQIKAIETIGKQLLEMEQE